MDQNEKLVHYGVTHVIAIDGFSSKIVGCTTMSIKNNLIIYQDLYRYNTLHIYNYCSVIVIMIIIVVA